MAHSLKPDQGLHCSVSGQGRIKPFEEMLCARQFSKTLFAMVDALEISTIRERVMTSQRDLRKENAGDGHQWV